MLKTDYNKPQEGTDLQILAPKKKKLSGDAHKFKVTLKTIPSTKLILLLGGILCL
jgi:hypothetical protein